jgi:hypothetical protein
MTNLVLSYARPLTRISLRQENDRFVGALTVAEEPPNGRMVISLSMTDPIGVAHPSPRELTGIVPPTAAAALIGLRVDAECGCSGRGEMRLGLAVYQDDGGVNIQRQLLRGPLDELQRLRAQPEHPLILNSPSFSVTPNRHFRLTVPMDASGDMARSGYLTMIFLDRQGKEVRRLRIIPTPSEIPLGKVTTDMNGRFEIPLTKPARAGFELQAEFVGTVRLRGSRATAPYLGSRIIYSNQSRPLIPANLQANGSHQLRRDDTGHLLF